MINVSLENNKFKIVKYGVSWSSQDNAIVPVPNSVIEGLDLTSATNYLNQTFCPADTALAISQLSLNNKSVAHFGYMGLIYVK